MAVSESVRQQISGLVASHRVVLFMKGTRRMPQCGFSAQVIQILDEVAPGYQSHDVLSSAELRDGIKEYSQWPTIPQLYIDGKFVGGCDIVRDLKASGELEQLLAADAPAPKAPQIVLTEAAARAFKAAMTEGDTDVLRLQISPQYEHDLFFGPQEPLDIQVQAAGLTLHLDRSTARFADGLSVGYVEGPNAGFKIENPNQPPKVVELNVEEAKGMLDRGEIQLFDVRPETESAIARIAAGRSLDSAGMDHYLRSLDPSTPIAFYCHHGIRSRGVAEQMLSKGFKKVYNLRGGIDAWSQTVDPSVVRY